VFDATLPVYFHALEFTTEHETTLHVQHISSELGRARASVERLEKSKSDFIAVAAHELKTPLTLIEGYATMLAEIFPDSNPETAQQSLYLKGIHSGNRRLREIVDDMIDVSMIDNNLLSIIFQPVWVNRLLDAIYRDMLDIARQRKLKLTIREFPGSGELTYGDGERLFQALKNLVANAIKYTPDGGSIIVDGRLLPGFIEVTVADTGIGIDPEDHLRIFEKFGRVGNVSLHSSGKTKFKGGGPGLGLPITKGIIESHGGAIWVESEGHDETRCPGSIFHVLLPLRKAPPPDKSEKLFRSTIERQSAV
jgi:signal transduction histidine kinase